MSGAAIHWIVTWLDRGREPQCPSDPRYPMGVDIDVSAGRKPSCTGTVPYPAKRCGCYRIVCRICGRLILVTTAGRADDPRTVTLACKNRKH